MEVQKYTFHYRYAGRKVVITIDATSLEEAEFVLSSIKELHVAYQNKKENGEENKG